ncbi:MAG TPA: hypothetical protein PK609_00480 [Candidatus Paceibacterota bacterium]|nr:hypothetical protein [Candidatus Paceibacterota bacterium]
MLLRRDLYRVITDEDEQEIERLFKLALDLRFRLPAYLEEVWLVAGRKYYPECHETAHAFAQIAGIEAVDGEHVVLTKTNCSSEEGDFGANYTTVLHSWNVFEVPSGQKFILDVLPVYDSSILPIVLQAPNPAYWIPKDALRVNALKQIQEPRMQHRIKNLAEAMQKVLES